MHFSSLGDIGFSLYTFNSVLMELMVDNECIKIACLDPGSSWHQYHLVTL